jgi:leader peptidase (prepilin peptidase)/N-methyltransferase
MWTAPYTSTVASITSYQVVGFVFGLLFGSFLNVCISRLPKHESVVHPPSHCPQCDKPIRWFDNIPLLGWIFLRGRCRGCRHAISFRYPLVELATGLWFWKFAWLLGYVTQLAENGRSQLSGSTLINFGIVQVGLAMLGFLLIGLVVMDWQTHLLPDAFTLTGIAIGLFLVCTQAIFLGPHEGDVILSTTHQLRMSSPGSNAAHGNVFMTGTEALVWGRVASVLGVAAILLLVRWLYKLVRRREGLGLGDVKLIAMIAAFLGFWPAILALFLGVLGATVYGLYLLARRKANRLTRLPLGSFLAAGGLVAALFGERLINSYTQMLR